MRTAKASPTRTRARAAGTLLDGVGNYSEEDIKNCARAFTGWTFAQPVPLYPHGFYSPQFLFREDDHDDGEKTFLGHTGNLNGDDIIDIIVEQPATARFISRHLYNFFVADEPQVPAWDVKPPQDPEAIEILSDAYMESKGEMRHILRTLFSSDFFKAARFKKVKSPTELITGVLKLVGTNRTPVPGMPQYADAATDGPGNCSTRPRWRVGTPDRSGSTAACSPNASTFL